MRFFTISTAAAVLSALVSFAAAQEDEDVTITSTRTVVRVTTITRTGPSSTWTSTATLEGAGAPTTAASDPTSAGYAMPTGTGGIAPGTTAPVDFEGSAANVAGSWFAAAAAAAVVVYAL